MNEDTTASIGDLFYIKGMGDLIEEYILAQVMTDEFCLIGLESGNRWMEPIKINITSFIEKKDVKKMFGNGNHGQTFEDFFKTKHKKSLILDNLFEI